MFFLHDCFRLYDEIFILVNLTYIFSLWTLSLFFTNTDQRIAELTSINQSLSCLGNCIRALEKGSAHIPYRDSKLTRLLEDSLGGNTKTSFVVTLSPSEVREDILYFILLPSSFFIIYYYYCNSYLVLYFFITHTHYKQ